MTEQPTPVRERERVELAEDSIDVRRYVRAVWSRRYRILLMTLASGVLAWLFTSRMIHYYESVAQIEMGPAAPAASTAKIQRVLTNPVFAADIIARHGLADAPELMTFDSFTRFVYVTPSASPDIQLIHVLVSDSALAISVANDVVQRLPGRVRASDAEAAKETIESWQAELKQSEQELLDAQAAVMALALEHPGVPRAAESQRSLHDELASIRTQIVGARARIHSADVQLERLRSGGSAAEPLRTAVSHARALVEIDLAGLVAGEEYLTAAMAGPPDGQAVPMPIKLKYDLLQADVARARRSRELALNALRTPAPADSPFPRAVEGQVLQAVQFSPNLFKNVSTVMTLAFLALLVASAVPVPSASKGRET